MAGKMDYYKACLEKGKKPKGMGYGDYSSFMKANGGDAMNEDAYNDMDEDEEGEEAAKSETGGTVDPDRLSKALTDYEAVEDALTTAGTSKESYLQARMDNGTITKAERVEYLKILDSETETGDPNGNLHKSLSDQLSETNDDAAALVDASDFLKSLIDSMDASLGRVHDEVSRDGHATRQLLKGLGGLTKALVQSHGEMVDRLQKSEVVIDALSKRLGLVEGTPAPRRSVGNHNPRDVQNRDLAKSAIGGTNNSEDQLSKSQVQGGLRTLMIKADEAGDDQAKQQIALATARYEYDGHVKPHMAQAIRQAVS